MINILLLIDAKHDLKNGITIIDPATIYDLSDSFMEDFLEPQKAAHLRVKY